MQLAGRAPATQFIFDSDMGNRIDTALAFAVMCGNAGRADGHAALAAVLTSKANLSSAAFCDAVRKFYERPQPPGPNGGAPRPVGYSKIGYRIDGLTPESTPLLDAVVGKKDAAGEPVYKQDADSIPGVIDSVSALRNTILDLPDASTVVVETGPPLSTSRAMWPATLPETIAQKVRLLVIAAGRYPSGSDDIHIAPDVKAMRLLLEKWPTRIVACGAEIGDELKFPASALEKFSWAQNHPIVDAYRAAQAMPYDATAWETAAALYAVRPEAGYFGLSAPGTISVDDAGRVSFAENAEGKHRYLTLDASKRQAVVDAMVELASSQPEPVPPPPPRPAPPAV